jgi:ATP-binding cassette, subfamily F, member 3
LLRNELQPDAGDAFFPASWRVAHVAQETPALDRPALEYAIDGDTHLRRLEAELAEAEAATTATASATCTPRWPMPMPTPCARAANNCSPASAFSHDQMNLPVASFSGGWRMRLNLAQALMCPSDLLLLDEPTNHLDLDAILWVEDWLKRYPGTLLIISHDRDFLDGVVNVIAHIDDRKLKRYGGNYSAFEKQRAINLALSQAAMVKQTRERDHLQSFIDRFKAKASKAKQAQSRMKMLAKMEELAPIHAAAAFQFEFREPDRAPNPLLVLEDVVAGYHTDEGDKPILRDINLNLQAGQRIGLLGVNGAGKSTLIKTIAGELAPLTGDAHWGKGLAIGYFAQHQVEMLRHDQSPLWHLAKIAPTVREQELRNFLGGFNFPGTMVSSPIAPFSGGEKARLALALIVWQKPNLLLLDEPTNHLDLETREALTVALAQFEGTLVLVSHDRHLLRATTEEFLIVADGSLKPFDGDLDDYRDWLFKTKLAIAKPAKPAKPEKPGKVEAAPVVQIQAAPEPVLSTAERKEQKRQEAEARQRASAQKKPIETRIKRLEEKMAKANARKAELDALLADPAIYAEDRKEAVKAHLFEQATLAKELEQLEGEWLEQQAELEALGV